MKLYEHQAKKLLSRYGIAIPRGFLASTPSEAKRAGRALKSEGCVVKAQVLAGARGKAGGIKLCRGAAEAEMAASSMLGKRLFTKQAGAQGMMIKRVLVEEAVDIDKEFYLGAAIDRGRGCAVVIVSKRGGIDIEDIARSHPREIINEAIDPFIGLMPYQARNMAYALGLKEPRVLVQAVKAMTTLSNIFIENDCSLLEINPWALTRDGHFRALDAKISFDESAFFRHAGLKGLRNKDEGSFLERKAARCGLSYVSLSGDIGCLVNGAGLAMAVADLIKLCGGEPANFLDVGGGASPEQVEGAFEILFKDKRIRALLVNIFGGIMKCDVIAKGVIKAVQRFKPKIPIVVRFEGTNVDEAKRMLDKSRLDLIIAEDMQEAAIKAVEVARVRG